jgi:hypothetical protein
MIAVMRYDKASIPQPGRLRLAEAELADPSVPLQERLAP